MSRPPTLSLPDEIIRIAERLERAGFETWCVGGAVRDALLGINRGDVDLATAARPEQVQELFRHTVPVGLRFGTVAVLDRDRHPHEVTTFRRDISTDGRHAVVEYGVSIDDDLARRDFTINAMAYHPLSHEWRDPFNGRDDLDASIIRAVGDPEARFREDYLRILRGIRFACRLDFSFDPETWAGACRSSGGLVRLSAERVRDEWFRSLETARDLTRLVTLWREVGALALWLPTALEGYPLASASPTDRDPVILTSLLVRSPAKVLTVLKGSNQEIERARRIERGPSAPANASEESVRRWMATVEPAVDDLLEAHRLRTGADPEWAAPLQRIRDRGDAFSREGLAVTGDDLRGLGIPSGPTIGKILSDLLEAVLADPALNRRETLLAMVKETLG